MRGKLMENLRYACKKCGITISGHNQFLHDSMCDECFFETYFPEEIELFETNPKRLSKLCEQQEEANTCFYKFLKSDKLNQRRFSNIVKEVTKKIDCTSCGNCCKKIAPDISNEDIKRISSYLSLSTEEFIQKYLKKTTEDRFQFKDTPCIFLQQNRCEIYKVRPEECKNYPYLQKDISTRCIQFFTNAEICPIVFNVLENTKLIFMDEVFCFDDECY